MGGPADGGGPIVDHLSGRRVLVTGAGGSIGASLCHRIDASRPAQLTVLDHDESAMHALQLSRRDPTLLDSDDVVLCDVRDTAALSDVIRDRRPEVVFHAAALKHLRLLERHPAEAVKTNVWGTRNVLEACESADVPRFVNVSTDKAADPCSVLGWSKRLGERLTAGWARDTDRAYVSVRFGNVVGSRGAVGDTFAHQIDAGGPVTVSSPEVSRYFMTLPEACDLLVRAADIGSPGEVLVLDMGEPVRILELARRMISRSGSAVDIEFTGLRPGEKEHEKLFADGEPVDVRPVDPRISHVPTAVLGAEDVDDLPVTGEAGVVREAMARLCARTGPAGAPAS